MSAKKRVVFKLTDGRRTEVVLRSSESDRMLAALKNGQTVEIGHGNTGGSTLIRQAEVWSTEVYDA